MKKIFVINGGIIPTDKFRYRDSYYSLTYDLKNEVGVIEKATHDKWILSTIIDGASCMNPSQRKSFQGEISYYQHYSTFDKCFEKLSQISKYPLEIVNKEEQSIEFIDYQASEYDEQNNTVIPKSDYSVLDQLHKAGLQITPGAEYKLELYFEFLTTRPVQFAQNVLNATVHTHIMKLHEERLQKEMTIIRPEDIPNFD